jgi:hypothetical protein
MTTSPGRLSQVSDLEEVNLDYFVSRQTTLPDMKTYG